MGAGTMSGRVALVTGGGSGIGLACARALLADGASVTICGRTEDRLAAAADELADLGSVQAVVADVTDEGSIAAAVAAAAIDGSLHAVVAAAGYGGLNRLERTTAEEWRGIVDTVLTGTFLTLKAAVRPMATAGSSSFVAISSVAGVRTHRYMAPYSAAKAGLDMLVRTAADELGDRGIRVSSVRPGLTETELVGMITADERMRADYLGQMPISKVGTVDEVASLVRFLCGPESGWITGETISVDGGHHLRRGPDFSSWIGPASDPR